MGLTISQSDAIAERLAVALDRLETLIATRDREVMRLRHIEEEARAALTEIEALLDDTCWTGRTDA